MYSTVHTRRPALQQTDFYHAVGTARLLYRIGPYFDVTEIRTIEADKLLRQLVTRKREKITHHILQVVRASGAQLKEMRRGTR